MKNYYDILEVNQKASKEVIEKAYKVLIKKYHPDAQISSKKYECSEKIKEINEAYEVLSNPFLRSQYDIELEKEEKRRNEIEYQRIVNEQNKKKEKENETNHRNQQKPKTEKIRENELWSFIDDIKEIFRNRKKREQIQSFAKKDMIAIGLTIVIIVILGIILWFVPFTNQFMRELLFENPIFNAIGALFSNK